jgi:hypothetical protein
MIGPSENLDAAVRDPTDYFGSLTDVVRRLTKGEKQRVLESWVLDAQLLSQAEAESMPGKERPRLQEAKLALLELQNQK